MKDIENFCKLFKVPCPTPRLFDHYVKTLIEAGDTKLQHQLDLYNARELLVENMYQDKKSYFISVQEILSATEASKKFNIINLEDFRNLFFDNPRPVNKMNDWNKASNEKYIFVSVDMISANYQTLRVFDKEGELNENWEDFLTKHNVPEVYRVAKIFRQYVFEQSNPMKTGKLQTGIMEKLRLCIDSLDKDLINDSIVFKSNDEMIFAFPDTEENLPRIELLKNIENSFKEYFILFNPIRLKVNLFYNTIIDGKIQYRTILNDDRSVEKKILKHVPSNLYFMYLRKFILNQEHNLLDTYFIHEGREAKWTEILK